MEMAPEDKEVLPELNTGFVKQQQEDPSLSENKQSIDVSSMSRKIDLMYTRTLKHTDLVDAKIMSSEELQQATPRKSKNPSPEIISERKSLVEDMHEHEELQSSSRENVQIYPTRTQKTGALLNAMMDPSDRLETPVVNKSIPEISVSIQPEQQYQELESSVRDQLNAMPTRKVKTSIYHEDNIASVSNIDIRMRDNDQMPPEQQNLRARQRAQFKASKVEIEPVYNADQAAR